MKRAGELTTIVLALSLLTASAVLAPSAVLHLANGSPDIRANGAIAPPRGPTPSLLSGEEQGQASSVASQQAAQLIPSLVQEETNFCVSVTSPYTCNTTFGSSVASGDAVLVLLECVSTAWDDCGTSLLTSVSEPGVTQSLVVDQSATSGVFAEWLYAGTCSSCSSTVSITYQAIGARAAVSVLLYEVRGISTSVYETGVGNGENYPTAGPLLTGPTSFPYSSGTYFAVSFGDVTDIASYGGCIGGPSFTEDPNAACTQYSTTVSSPTTFPDPFGGSNIGYLWEEVGAVFGEYSTVQIALSAQDGHAFPATIGGACSGTYTPSGGTQSFTGCIPGSTVTVTLPRGESNICFSFSGACTASESFTSCGGGACPTKSYNYYEQVQNTFTESLVVGTFASGLTWAYTGYQAGLPGTAICASSPGLGGTSASCKGWSDIGQAATAPAAPSGEAANERFENSAGSSSTAGTPTTGGNTYTARYYRQEGDTVQYALVGGGSPTAPTFTYTTFGTSGTTYPMTTSGVTKWLDYGTGWTVSPNPLAGSGSSERWQSSSPLSGTATGGGTIDPSFYNQYLQSVAYSVACATGATCNAPTLTYDQYGSSVTSTLATNAQSFWVDSGSVASVSTTITDSLNEVYTPYVSSWLISGANEFAAPVQYWRGL